MQQFLRASQEAVWTPQAGSRVKQKQTMQDLSRMVGEPDRLLGIADLYGAEIRNMRDSMGGQKQQMSQDELIQEDKNEDQLMENQERQKKIEELFVANTQKIAVERKELADRERSYRKHDNDKLQVINRQRQKIAELERRQQELLTLMEEIELNKHPNDCERMEPIGESCSEESLAIKKEAGYTRPTKSSLLKKQQRSMSDPASTHKQGRYSSPVQVHHAQQPDEKVRLSPRSRSTKLKVNKQNAGVAQINDRSDSPQQQVKNNVDAKHGSNFNYIRSHSAPVGKRCTSNREEASGDELRDNARTTPEGLGEVLSENILLYIPPVEPDLVKDEDAFYKTDNYDDHTRYRHKEQSPSPCRTRQLSDSPGRTNSRGRGRARERTIPGKQEKPEPRPGTATSYNVKRASKKGGSVPCSESAQSPKMSRRYGIEKQDSVSSSQSPDMSESMELMHRDSGSSLDSSISQSSSTKSGTKSKSSSSDSIKADSKMTKGKKAKSAKSGLDDNVLSKPKKKKSNNAVEIFVAGSYGGSGGAGEDNVVENPMRQHTDPTHELFAKSLRSGSAERDVRPFREEFSSSDGAKYISRRSKSDDADRRRQSDDASSNSTRSEICDTLPFLLSPDMERMVSGQSSPSQRSRSVSEFTDSLESPAALLQSPPAWSAARDRDTYSDDSLDERLTPEGSKQSPRDHLSPLADLSNDSLDHRSEIKHHGILDTKQSFSSAISPDSLANSDLLTSAENQTSPVTVGAMLVEITGPERTPTQVNR